MNMGEFFKKIDNHDVEVIKRQLNTKSVNVMSIIDRCTYGFPSVIQLNPLKINETESAVGKGFDYMSISILLWLSCPFLNDKIHILENRGFIKKISNFINTNNELKLMMKDAHANFYYLRKDVCRKFNHIVKSIGNDNSVYSTGIGGIRNIDHIKCLHIHYSHYKICSENIIGKITYYLLNKITTCEEGICKNVSGY